MITARENNTNRCGDDQVINFLNICMKPNYVHLVASIILHGKKKIAATIFKKPLLRYKEGLISKKDIK